MKEGVTKPQTCDMGSGFGYVDGVAGHTLKDVLDFYAEHSNDWGTVSIYRNGSIVRKFDYDTYNKCIFYHHLNGWEYRFKITEVTFTYCFMNKDIEIYVE